jgi:hypothetical protein
MKQVGPVFNMTLKACGPFGSTGTEIRKRLKSGEAPNALAPEGKRN